MLFTNGTGTGKTFSGLGIVKRFARQGKTNTLIVAPSDKIIEDWIDSAKALGLTVTRLTGTNEAGTGIVITTYAAFGANRTLADRSWDLVVTDEAHYLAQAADGEATTFLRTLRAITMHPEGDLTRAYMIHRELIDRRDAMRSDLGKLPATPALEALDREIDEKRKAMTATVKASQGDKRPRAVFLSATPFAYEKAIDWANGYLFDYNEGQGKDNDGAAYNSGDNRERFFMQSFGYRMRYNKLTQPDANVDSGVMQRQFNTLLKRSGSLSSRILDVAADYDRKFILAESAIGTRIDAALQWVHDQRGDAAHEFARAISKRFDHLSRRFLLEAIKADEVMPHIREHMARGRKVVVFHDYKKGGGFNPFDIPHMGDDYTEDQARGMGGAKAGDYNALVDEFRAEFRDLVNYPFASMPSPINAFRREFPGLLLFNGDVSPKDRRAAVAKFNDDASGPQIILVQSAAGKEGISLHDTTGKHQRVLFNLGLPTQPTTAIQQEGRIYRTGQVTDALFRYLNTGTNWERLAFATTIATRSSTAENLALGEQARALRDAFISGFEESSDYRAGDENEGKGGKERDRAANEALTEFDRARAFYFGTQKKNSRTKAQEGTDYFATPEPLGLKMVEWADIRPGETALEPSAGHGAIARWFPETNQVTVIEPSNELSARLAMVRSGQGTRMVSSKFEDHDVVNKYDVIVMNPPFGSGGRTAIDHLDKAARHLRDGGRIVALIPTGPAADAKFQKWFFDTTERPINPLVTHPVHGPIYKGDTITTKYMPGDLVVALSDGPQYVHADKGSVRTLFPLDQVTSVKPTGKRVRVMAGAAGLHLTADIELPAVTFERAGTQVRTRILVIDKIDGTANPGQSSRDYTDATTIKDFFDRIEHSSIPSRMKARPAEEAAPEPTPAAARGAAKSDAKAAKQAAAAAGEQAAAAAGEPIVEHVTQNGKTLRGVVRSISQVEAKALDAYTFRKNGGFFIRLENLDPDKADNPPPGWEFAEPAERLSDEVIEREVAKARAAFPGFTITVLDSIQDSPASAATKAKYPGANGLTDGVSRVWIFRNAQSLQALRMTLAHEITGHIGVESVIGSDWPAVQAEIERIRKGASMVSPALANAVKAAVSRYPKADPLTFARESVAIMAETGVTGSLWDRIVAAVRKYLRKVFGSLQWNENEIRDLLRRAGDSVRSKPAVFRGAEFEAAQVVFHGTPHKVDRFRMSKIGTGEGNQAYGWGVYFASRRGVADFYRDALTGASVKFASEETKNKLLSGDADRAIAFARGQIKEGGSISSVIEETRQGARNFRDRKPTSYRREGPDLAMAAAFDAVADALESGDLVIEKEKGNLYSVEAPEDSDLLDWDKPLSEQPEKVRDAIENMAPSLAGLTYNIGGNTAAITRAVHSAKNEKIMAAARDKWHAAQDAYSFLIGDKSVSFDTQARKREAMKAAQEAYEEAVFNSEPVGYRINHDMTGSGLYRAMQAAMGQEAASRALNDAGIPGLRYLDGTSRNKGEGSHNYVIWSEEAIGEPTMLASNPEPAKPFFSALVRSIDEAKGAPKRANADAWSQWLDGAQRRGAFKQSERDWLGVDAWLDGRDSTTREELAEFVRANQVEVQETVLGEGGSDMQAVLDEYAEDIFDQPFDDLSADEQARVESEAAEDSRLKYSDPTKFSGYQLPGGQNYRELLLTMPVSTTLPDGFSLKQIEAGPRKGQWAVLGPGPLAENRYGSGATQAEAIANFGAHGHNGPTYKSSHFDQPNILAHVRFNERTDADGKRVLFVEEVQSDWHQAGRKHGYVGTTRSLKEIVADMDAVTRELRARTGRYASEDGDWESNSDLMTRRDALDAEGASARSSKAGGVPDAPLKREWPLTAMKRMIRYAADNGFDRIAWTTGDQQAERYDLSKQISAINYEPFDDGIHYELEALDLNGKQVVSEDEITIDRVEALVGKDIAKKIEAGEGKVNDDSGYRNWHRLSGLDLKVGGSGMRAFYDKMLPNELAKYVKKWGGKVGSARIKTGDELKKFLPQQYDDEFGIDDSILDARVPGLSFKTYDEAEARASEMNGVGTLVHAVDITPSMREAAMQGQPLFSNPAQGPIERQMAEDARAGQPIDKLFRLPFHLFGLDSHGRLKPGTKLYDWLTRVVAEKMPAEDGAFGWAIPIIKSVRSGLIDRYGVPADFVQRDERRESEVRSVLMHAARVAADLEGLTTAEAKVLQAMLTGQEMPAGELGKLSQPIKEAIDQMGREAVEMGLISPEAYERNRGAYLHRSYLKYEADRTPLGKAIGRFLDKRRKRLMGDTLRGRGMTMERDAGTIAAALGGSIADGDMVTVFRQKTEAGGVRTKYQRGPLNGPAPVGWENLGDWRVMGFDGKKAKLWRDFTPAEREKMGEILDARYNITKTFALMAHDLATGRFLRDIAANPEWARQDLPEGATAAEARGRYDTYSDSDWVRVPDAAIPGTNDGKGNPVKRWGALAGMYVRAPIWRDLNQLREMQNPQVWGSVWNKVLTFWKTNKTARNPVVHVNNVMSNMMFMDLADIRLRDLYRAIGAWRRGESDDDYRDAMAHGAFGGGFADQELKRKVLQPILDDILAKQKTDGQDTAEDRLSVLHLLSTIWDSIKKADGKMLDAYNAEDEIFRLAFYLRRQSLGDTPEEAARAARRQFIDYDIRAPWVNAARNTVLPFIGYTYRSIPILAQAIAERPWKLAKYATLAAAANWLGYLFAPGDEDDERKVMSPTVQGNAWTGTPRMIRMPWYDGDGNPVFLDVRRWIPAGDVFDMNQSEIGLPAWLQFGGPLQIAGELMLNKQAFTRQPIVDPLTDTTTEKAGKTVSWAWKAFMPNAPWIPESYSWDKLQQAATGATDDLGRDYSALEASASVLGIKAAGHDVDLQRRYRAMDFDRHERELDFEISALKREMSKKAISRERFDANLAKIIAKKKLLNDERRRVLSR